MYIGLLKNFGTEASWVKDLLMLPWFLRTADSLPRRSSQSRKRRGRSWQHHPPQLKAVSGRTPCSAPKIAKYGEFIIFYIDSWNLHWACADVWKTEMNSSLHQAGSVLFIKGPEITIAVIFSANNRIWHASSAGWCTHADQIQIKPINPTH